MTDFMEHQARFKADMAALEVAVVLDPELEAEIKADGNRNNLANYWKRGKGALRIRWGTPGDFTRCEAALDSKVGEASAKRMCAQWHHDMTGMWSGDARNR